LRGVVVVVGWGGLYGALLSLGWGVVLLFVGLFVWWVGGGFWGVGGGYGRDEDDLWDDDDAEQEGEEAEGGEGSEEQMCCD
jgi:hypothetical protein